MPDPIDLEALEALANAATPGPWTPYETVQADNFVTAGGGWLTGTIICGPSYEIRNVRYIAAAHPEVVLALIAEIRELRAHPLRRLAHDQASVVIDTDAISEGSDA